MRRGFTLVELMLVVIIIGILVGMVVPRLVGRSEEARKTAAKADVSGSIALALDLYEMDVGSFPDKLADLCTAPADPKRAQRWKGGPYLKNCPPLPNDPWGNPYKYEKQSDGTYRLWSCGPDGMDNSGEGDDIASWKRDEGEAL